MLIDAWQVISLKRAHELELAVMKGSHTDEIAAIKRTHAAEISSADRSAVQGRQLSGLADQVGAAVGTLALSPKS